MLCLVLALSMCVEIYAFSERMHKMEEDQEVKKKKQGNNVQTWGSATTMNINTMIHTNILSSPYFKKNLFTLKTYHEVVDEIYYKVAHLEPWEKGSRKTSGQVGMCGGVRGVGAGGIVSSCYCLLFKLFTLKLTRKQLKGLIDHCDSPYIRGIGFMYIRYCIQPRNMWSWMEPYLEDEEEVDVKAGGGCTMTIGQLVRSFLLRLEWYGTLFPRIPVPVEKEIRENLTQLNLCDDHKRKADDGWGEAERQGRSRRPDDDSFRAKSDNDFGEAERFARLHHHSSRERSRDRSNRGDERHQIRRSRTPNRSRQEPDRVKRDSNRERRDRRSRDRSREKAARDGAFHDKEKHRRRSRSRDRMRQRSDGKARSRDRSRERPSKNGKDRPHRSRSRDRSSKDRNEKPHRSHSRERGTGERKGRSHRSNSRDLHQKENEKVRRHDEKVRRNHSRERSRERRKRSRSNDRSRDKEYLEKTNRRLHEGSSREEKDDYKKKGVLIETTDREKKLREEELANDVSREHGGHSKDHNDYQVSVNNENREQHLMRGDVSFELEAGELRDDEETSPKHKKKKKKDREGKKSKDERKINEKLGKKHKSKKSKKKHKDSGDADLDI